ncbi:MAG TPA: cytochrome c [Gemmatimonadales bacterium]|nr:cytochrome c [Gemmatimonadales bacterium]
MRPSMRALLVAALALGSAGCEAWYNRVPSPDQLWYIVPWFDHMIQQRSVHPYESGAVPRNTVPGTVPITGGEANWEAEFKAGNSATADRLVNPYAGGATPADSLRRRGGPDVPALPATLAARGDSAFGTYCAVCHGLTGNGQSPITPRFPAPSLLTPQAQGRSDGYIYSMIRYGRGLMPRYGDKVYRPEDRWAIVNHVRRLQAAGAGASADSAAVQAQAASAGDTTR